MLTVLALFVAQTDQQLPSIELSAAQVGADLTAIVGWQLKVCGALEHRAVYPGSYLLMGPPTPPEGGEGIIVDEQIRPSRNGEQFCAVGIVRQRPGRTQADLMEARPGTPDRNHWLTID